MFVEPISLNDNIHPAENEVCALYIRGIDDSKGYLINLSHSEATNCSFREVFEMLKEFEEIFVVDKKSFMHFFLLKNLTDIHFISPTDIQHQEACTTWFYRRYPELANVGAVIPIVKHYERCSTLYDEVKHVFTMDKPEYFEFYNGVATNVFWWVEQEGIEVDKERFKHYFDKTIKTRAYTQFNLKTTTTRPSNKFGGVNYAALDKKNGCRSAIVPSNDFLLEIDIAAYHPTLAGKLVGYEFPEGDVHQAFADMYGTDYKTAKQLTFKQLYGGVFKEYKDLEFFRLVEGYIEGMTREERFVCPSGYVFDTRDKKPQVLFNYVLQNMETYFNILILEQIIRKIKDCNTRIVHYTYDSFLLDVDKTEKSTIEDIISIFNELGLRVKMAFGADYHSLAEVPYV